MRVILAIALPSATLGLAQAQTPLTVPGRGGELVTFPLGAASFADRVVAMEMGSPAASAEPGPAVTLGPPDDAAGGGAQSLGCGGRLTLAFEDNLLVDVDGPDLYVFEVGPAVEATFLEVSIDGAVWHDAGKVAGSTAVVDLAALDLPDVPFAFVRLTDARTGCSGQWPGADIDAVGAIGAIEVPGLMNAPDRRNLE